MLALTLTQCLRMHCSYMMHFVLCYCGELAWLVSSLEPVFGGDGISMKDEALEADLL